MERVKIKMYCKCGESIVLRGTQSNGKIETGFKQCFCGNQGPDGFRIEILEQYSSRTDEME